MKLAVFVVGAMAIAVPARAASTPQCQYKGDPAACFPYACVPMDANGHPDARDPDLIVKGTAGQCGPCVNDDQCGGAKCFVTGPAKGTCARYDGSPAPTEIWPRFGLVVADVSVNVADRSDARPIVSVGYLFQAALRGSKPVAREDGGFITPDPPRWYGDAGLSAAFAGPSQNLFVTVGITHYRPSLPLGLTTISVGALYQRGGSTIWKVWDTDVNQDRLGPSLTAGFLQNLYVRGAYVFGVTGHDHHGAVILSVVYMRDLIGDLLSDRFSKYLPKALK